MEYQSPLAAIINLDFRNQTELLPLFGELLILQRGLERSGLVETDWRSLFCSYGGLVDSAACCLGVV